MKFQRRDPQSILGSAIYILDMVMISVAAYLAHYLKFNVFAMEKEYVIAVIFAVLVHIIVSDKVYMCRDGGLVSVYKRVFFSWVIVVNVIFTVSVLTSTSGDFSRVWFSYWIGISIILFFIYRYCLFKGLFYIGIDGINKKRVLIVGRCQVQQELVRRASSSNWTGFSVIGILGFNETSSIEQMLDTTNLDEVWVCASFQNNDNIQKVISMFKLSTVTIRIIQDISSLSLLNGGHSSILGLPAIDVTVSKMSGINLLVKWLEDKSLSIGILILILPILLAIAVAIKITSEGPVIFKQKRHGWNGKVIDIYKFRTMKNASPNNVVVQATIYDVRITPLGTFLRKYSLDELPQFFNVLFGDMSIVGPRPHATQHNEDYMQRIKSYMLRHKVKPGITGWAQISGHRGETELDSKMISRVEHDLYYIEKWSLWLDISIVFKTIFVGFRHKNAY